MKENIETIARSAETDEDVIVQVECLKNKHGVIDNYRVTFTCPDCRQDKVMITQDLCFQCDCGEFITMTTRQEFLQRVFESDQEHIEYLRENGLHELSYPISFWTKDLAGDDIIVMATEYLGHGRWRCLDEDFEEIICLAKDLCEPSS